VPCRFARQPPRRAGGEPTAAGAVRSRCRAAAGAAASLGLPPERRGADARPLERSLRRWPEWRPHGVTLPGRSAGERERVVGHAPDVPSPAAATDALGALRVASARCLSP
jgi:hypothetical protein